MENDVLLLHETAGELREDTAVVVFDAGAEGLGEAGHLDGYTVLGRVGCAEAFHHPFAFGVAAPHGEGIDEPVVRLGNGRVLPVGDAVHFERGEVYHAGDLFVSRELEETVGAVDGGLNGLDRTLDEELRTGGAGAVDDVVDGLVVFDGTGEVADDEVELPVRKHIFEHRLCLLLIADEGGYRDVRVVEAICLEQSPDHLRTDETGGAGDEDGLPGKCREQAVVVQCFCAEGHVLAQYGIGHAQFSFGLRKVLSFVRLPFVRPKPKVCSFSRYWSRARNM